MHKIWTLIFVIGSTTTQILGVATQLGEDWLLSQDHNELDQWRAKRAAGYLIEDVVVNMTEVARQTLGENEMNIGDSITFQMEIDFPGLAISEKTDLVIEIFGLKPDTGIAGFHICQAHMIDPRGSNVKAIQDYPHYTETNMLEFPNLIQKTKLQFQQVHTNNISDLTNNKIGVQFQAVMVPTSGMLNGQDYYITAGTEYGEDTFVWVGQAKMTANLIEKIYEAKVELKSPEPSLSKGSSALFVIEAYITDPAVSIDFGAFQPLGYSDLFHIGQITVQTGNAFACSDPKFWKERYLDSPTQLSVVNASLTYPLLINREVDRIVSEEKNKIVFYVPVHVLNVDTISVGRQRSLAFGLKIGNSKLWTALHEIEITPYVPPSTIGTITIDSHFLLNNLTALEGVVVGDAAIFKVGVTVPSGWVNFDIVMEGLAANGIFPVGARIVQSGAIGYFPPEWLVKTRNSDESLLLEYSTIQNTSPDPTTVILELSFSTNSNSTPEGTNTVSATIGGESLSLEFSTVQNNISLAITFEADDIGWDDKFYVHGQAALNVRVTIPSTAGKDDLYLEAVPDFDQTDVSAKICQLRILEVGHGLPCLHHRIRDNLINFNRSHPDRPFFDFASLHLGQTCPTRSNEAPEDNDFLVQIVYELPPQESVTTGTNYKISAGFKIDESTIWVSTREMTLDSLSLEGLPIESSYSEETTPFVTSYPIVSTQDRSSPILRGNEVFFIQYLIKTQRGTRGHYVFTILPSASVKVCKLEIVHIGANLPCTEPPGPSITGYENVVIEYGADPTVAHDFGEPAKLIFKGLTNWGRSHMIPDLTPDADAIQIRVFFQAKEDIGSKNETIDHTLSPGSDTDISGSHRFEFSDEALARNVSALSLIEVKSLLGSNTSIWKHATKVMHVDVFIPDHFYADLWLDVIHENMAEERILDICSISLIDVGDNLPCVRKNDVHNATYLEDPQYIQVYNNEEETVHGGVQIKIPGVCYMAYSDKPEANKLTFLLAMRVRDDVADGEVLNLKLVAKSEDTDQTTHAMADIALTVETPNEGDISTSPISVDEVKVEPDPLIGPEMVVSPGRSVWVPFHVHFPPEKILPMEASVLLPSEGGKAIFHADDMKFGASTGKNILCTGSDSLKMDLRRAYETTFDQSHNVTTFMQKDSITTNLGYMQNSGLTIWQETHNDSDDKFVIEVKVQLADHIVAINDAIFTVTFAVKFGSIIVIAEQTMKVDRSLSPGVGRIVIDGELLQSNITFNTLDVVHVESLIYHDLESFIEGHPTSIRVITPKYLALTENNIITSNYTLNHTQTEATLIPEFYSNGTLYGGFDVEFPQGISFPDIISLNLTLTVDPENIRKPGSGNEEATIVLSPICTNPATNSNLQCGSFVSFEIAIGSTECMDLIPIIHECQVSASGLLSNLTGPFNSIGTSDAWSPPIRSGNEWNPYLEFDFLGVARVNRLSFQVPGGSAYQQILKVIIQASNVPGFFTDVAKVAPSTEINFSKPIVARYLRILVSDIDSTFWDEKPIGINSVQWYGCMPKEFEANDSLCQPSAIARSDDPTQYRHFAFDEAQNIVYVCDRNPHSGMVCYSSDRNVGFNVWTELPRYISYIEGYSSTTGRTYFREAKSNALLSSANGKVIQLDDTLPSALEPARVVSGKSLPGFVDVLWPTGVPKGTYNGIKLQSDELVLQWSTCCS